MSTPTVRVLALAGSLRRDSWNKKLLNAEVTALRALGAEVDVLDLAAVDMPHYHGDLEENEGLPAGAQEFKRRLAAADALVIATPEYNAAIPGVLKNAIDWASRGPEKVFAGKITGLMAAAPGQGGGMRAMAQLRQMFDYMQLWLVPQRVTVAFVNKVFDEQGRLTDPLIQKQVDEMAREIVAAVRRHHPVTV